MTVTTCDTPSIGAYRLLVGKALRVDRFSLEDFPVLSELPIVEQWATAHPQQLLPRARALEALLRAAVADALRALEGAHDVSSHRLALFIQRRYNDCATVTAIAGEIGIDRTAVHHRIAPRALDLVTRRFLQLTQGSALRSPGGPDAKAS